MNKKDVISFYKRELREIEISKQVLEQSLTIITRREYILISALEKLGAQVPTRKGGVLTTEKKLDLLASLTK